MDTSDWPEEQEPLGRTSCDAIFAQLAHYLGGMAKTMIVITPDVVHAQFE